MLINMKEMLKVANENNFAVPAFNISSLPMLNGVFKKCEELKSPVIIAIHPDELSYVEEYILVLWVWGLSYLPCCLSDMVILFSHW